MNFIEAKAIVAQGYEVTGLPIRATMNHNSQVDKARGFLEAWELVEKLAKAAKELPLAHDTITDGKYIGIERHDKESCRACIFEEALAAYEEARGEKK